MTEDIKRVATEYKNGNEKQIGQNELIWYIAARVDTLFSKMDNLTENLSVHKQFCKDHIAQGVKDDNSFKKLIYSGIPIFISIIALYIAYIN